MSADLVDSIETAIAGSFLLGATPPVAVMVSFLDGANSVLSLDEERLSLNGKALDRSSLLFEPLVIEEGQLQQGWQTVLRPVFDSLWNAFGMEGNGPLNSLFALKLPDGVAQLEASVRGSDDNGHLAFSVEFNGLPRMFGEWKPKFTGNAGDFDIEIIGFGWISKYALGNTTLGARILLPTTEHGRIMRAIIALFNCNQATHKDMPFTSQTARFSGVITFTPNWVES